MAGSIPAPGSKERGRAISQNYINHIALVLDRSVSMTRLRDTVVRVADNLIAHLAQRSRELDQETRITVYLFGSTVECVIYDKDVLRLPSIGSFYRISGNTALIDATLKSQDDLAQTAQLYGDHAFLTYVLTDGEENVSQSRPERLTMRLNELPDNWTVAAFVPNQTGVFEAKKFGFPPDNIAIWDTSVQGLERAGEVIRTTTDTYMQNRATGVRGSRNLFSTGVDALNTQTVKAAKLQELPAGSYHLYEVSRDRSIRDFVEDCGHTYHIGRAFYLLMKRELIQAGKQVAVMEKATGKIYTGINARNLLGLRAADERVKPDQNPLYDVFVQSTSTNRKLISGTKLLLLV